VAKAEAYLRAKFHLDPSDRLATVHERYRQDRTDNGPVALGEPFYKRSPKNELTIAAPSSKWCFIYTPYIGDVYPNTFHFHYGARNCI